MNASPRQERFGPAIARLVLAVTLASTALVGISSTAGADPVVDRGAVKPLDGHWSGKTNQPFDPDILAGGSITFDVFRDGKARYVEFLDSTLVVRCVAAPGGPSPGKYPSPVRLSPGKVRKGSFEAEIKVPGTLGYHDTVKGEFETKNKASGTLRSRWTGNRDCDSGKVKWSAKLSSPPA